MAAEVDVGYVAGHLGLDQPVITTLTTEPTVDLVTTLLVAVAAKAHEFDTLYAEKLRTDIELENNIRSAESRAQSFKATADNAINEAQKARQLLKDEGLRAGLLSPVLTATDLSWNAETKRQLLENELQILTTKNLDHEAQIKALSDKIENLQTSNRTNLSIIESNTKRDQTVAEELTKQHQRNTELARQNADLQQSEQSAKSQLSSAKYREDSLKQQLDLARRNSEWLENELKTKGDEALRFRKEKGARIAELQRECEDAKSRADVLKRTEEQLRERIVSIQAKADEAVVNLQKQEVASASTVDSYKQELQDQRRLVDMSEQLGKKHQERVRELEAEKERLKNNHESEVRRIRIELEQEKRTISDMEAKIQQLESQLDEMHARMDRGAPPDSVPQTPRPNGSVMGGPASPFGTYGTPASARRKSGFSATQTIEQLFQVKGQLASEKRRSQQLSEELDGVIAALEAKAPEILELQSDVETLRSEISRMSELSQQSFEERDAARKAARKAEAALGSAQSETKILKTQLRDLGTQIQMLVFSMHAQEKGLGQLTEEEKYRFRQLERGETTEEALSDQSDTHQFITQKLVVFKDIQSLQAKNQELMRITRELAEQLESEEALAAKHQAKLDHDKVDKLQQDLDHMVVESRSTKNTMESYKAERDMFRRILQQRGHGPDEASATEASMDESQRPPLASIEGDQSEALSEALRKLQSEYDSFRDAQSDVRADLRKQIDNYLSEKNQLQTERIKLLGDLRIESERRDMLQGNYSALQAENVELQKRSQTLLETAARQDIRTQQVAEELIEAKGLLDSMRNENANLKAEKKLWKDIQERMSKDNENLIEEKNRLNQILATQQSLENERSITESEARRSAQEKIDRLERELGDALRKLSSEAEESRNLRLRKEFEAKESQKRIDELMQSLTNVREEHVEAKTAKDHLQARVNELVVELRNAEDRVGRLQPRPTPRPAAGPDANQRQLELEAEVQELNDDVSNLKRDLDLTNSKLEHARTQVDQYKELSQSNEEAVEDLRASQDQYRQEMESLINEKESKIKELEQRAGDLSAELSRSNSELSTLRDSQNEVSRKYEDEKIILQDELGRLKEDIARHAEGARHHQQDLRAQAEIASKAQQDYEQELVKHAEAAKTVQQLRSDYNELKSQITTLRAEAESAKVALLQNETSWDEQRQQLEREMAEVTMRREDVNAQNKLLHQQLDALTVQITALQRNRGVEGDAEEFAPTGDAHEGLRELNVYLRREKEILEVQYDLKSQESKRLQQQMDYLQSQLDEARLKLDQERAQSAQSGGRNSMTHQGLMEKLNELNLYRESSAALRNENVQLKDQIVEKNKQIEQLQSKIQPLEAELAELRTSKSYLEDEVKQIQEDRDRWQKRTEGILTKYGRADPAEMESLKKTIAELEADRDALKGSEDPLRAQIAELESTLEDERQNWQTTRSKIADQFKERSKRLTGEKNEFVQLSNELQQRLDQSAAELEEAQKRTQEALRDKVDLGNEIESWKQQVEQLRQDAQSARQAQEQSQGAPSSSQPSPLTEVVSKLEHELADAQKALEAIGAQNLGVEMQLETLRSELQSAIADRDEARQRLHDAAAASGASSEPSKPILTDREAGEVVEPAQSAELSNEERESLSEKLALAESQIAELEQKMDAVQQSAKERCDKMRNSLNDKLLESRGRFENQLKQKDEELQLRIEQEKLIWQAESRAAEAKAAESQTAPASQPGNSEQSPQTPTAATSVADLAQLDDTRMRQFLASNATAKSIISSNLKKRVELESVKIKGDIEAKITAARDQAQLMESKKSTLRINMAENKLKIANTKLGVVETAATETPEKPVAEVWEVVVKVPSGPGGPAAPSTPVKEPGTPKPALASDEQEFDMGTSAHLTAKSTDQNAETAAQEPKPAEPEPKPAQPQQKQLVGSSSLPMKPLNPFAPSGGPGAKDTPQPNPFAPRTEPAAGSSADSQAIQAGQQQASGGPRTSGIPMPRGGGRGRGGTYLPPGQRSGSFNYDGGQSDAAQGGRGKAPGGINPGAAEFQPGSKRPRGGPEGGRGPKRARGGH